MFYEATELQSFSSCINRKSSNCFFQHVQAPPARSASRSKPQQQKLYCVIKQLESERYSVLAAFSVGGLQTEKFHFPLSVGWKLTLGKPCNRRTEKGQGGVWVVLRGIPSWCPMGAQQDGWGEYRTVTSLRKFHVVIVGF